MSRPQRPPRQRDTTRINEKIRAREVRLIGPDGHQIGVVSLKDALLQAEEADLDLVEVAPQARPPVCKILDYSKYRYEQKRKAREARKHQKKIVIREIKLRPKIADHDFQTKRNHAQRFLLHGAKVKASVMFRGREMSHPELGRRLLERLAEDLVGYAEVEIAPRQEGYNMVMMLVPRPDLASSEAGFSAQADQTEESSSSDSQ